MSEDFPEVSNAAELGVFFGSSRLAGCFRNFLAEYRAWIPTVRIIVLPDDSHELLLAVRDSGKRQEATVRIKVENGRIRTSVQADAGHSLGVIQMVLMLMNTHDFPRYRMELKNNLQAIFYCEEPLERVKSVDDFHKLTVRLTSVAEKLEEMA